MCLGLLLTSCKGIALSREIRRDNAAWSKSLGLSHHK